MLLAEELLDLTLEDLIEEYGANFVAVETWYGYEFQLRLKGTVISTVYADVEVDDELTFFDHDFGPDFDPTFDPYEMDDDSNNG